MSEWEAADTVDKHSARPPLSPCPAPSPACPCRTRTCPAPHARHRSASRPSAPYLCHSTRCHRAEQRLAAGMRCCGRRAADSCHREQQWQAGREHESAGRRRRWERTGRGEELARLGRHSADYCYGSRLCHPVGGRRRQPLGSRHQPPVGWLSSRLPGLLLCCREEVDDEQTRRHDGEGTRKGAVAGPTSHERIKVRGNEWLRPPMGEETGTAWRSVSLT